MLRSTIHMNKPGLERGFNAQVCDEHLSWKGFMENVSMEN